MDLFHDGAILKGIIIMSAVTSSIKQGLFERIPGSITAWIVLVGYLVVVK